MKLILLTTLISLTTAIFIDHGLQDGIYTAYPDPSNPEEQILRRDIGASHGIILPRGGVWTNRTLKDDLPIPKGKKFCWEGHNFNRSDFYPSINDLFVEPLYWMGPNSVKFSLHGSVVTYICNLGWMNSASLLEFMEAMDQIDEKCGETVGGKISIAEWEKMYGRESRGEEICEWESEPGGLENNLMEVQACENFVNGVDRWLDRGQACNENSGWSVWAKVKKMFPWYHKVEEVDDGSELVDPQSHTD